MQYTRPFRDSWKMMLQRCYNPNCNGWPFYGKRGIVVCERWKRFENFYADLHASWFPGATLDRKDAKGNYEPENCCWILKVDQTSVGRQQLRYNNKTGIKGVEYTRNRWRVIVRERGKPRGKGKKMVLYSGTNFFEACCVRMSWEARESQILQFWNRCAKHDWSHSMSDDMRVWRKGRAERLALEEAAGSNPQLKRILDQWFEHIRGQRKELPPVPQDDAIPEELNNSLVVKQ